MERTEFVGQRERADGYNGHTTVTFIVRTPEHGGGFLEVHPSGWHSATEEDALDAYVQDAEMDLREWGKWPPTEELGERMREWMRREWREHEERRKR
jgi:hypothetical protein